MVSQADLETFHKYSSHHRDLLVKSDRAGCFHCGAVFSPSEISEWIDGDEHSGRGGEGVTALCPKCGIDAVLPSASPVPLTGEVLAAMERHWFE